LVETAQRLLAEIRELAPAITVGVAEIEAGRRITLDLPAALEIIGLLGRVDRRGRDDRRKPQQQKRREGDREGLVSLHRCGDILQATLRL
jgi:hypothetical protein